MSYRTRLGRLAALAGLFAALVVVAAPTAARADTVPYFCQTNPVQARDSFFHERHDGKDWLYVFGISYYAPTFHPGTRSNRTSNWIFDNEDSATPVTQMATDTVAVERSAASTSGVTVGRTIRGINLTNRLERTVTEKITVTSSVTNTYTIEEYTAKQVEYGIFGFDVIYDVDVYVLHDRGTRCEYRADKSAYGVLANFPSYEGWRVRVFPRVNAGGVVNAQDYSYNIRPCDIVAIFGDNFQRPDQVIVRQNNRLWFIGQGSPWWYDSKRQINATLPCDIQSNASITVAVKSSNGLESLRPRQVFITA